MPSELHIANVGRLGASALTTKTPVALLDCLPTFFEWREVPSVRADYPEPSFHRAERDALTDRKCRKSLSFAPRSSQQ